MLKSGLYLMMRLKQLTELLKINEAFKKELTNSLVDTMKNNEIDCFDLTGGSKLNLYKK